MTISAASELRRLADWFEASGTDESDWASGLRQSADMLDRAARAEDALKKADKLVDAATALWHQCSVRPGVPTIDRLDAVLNAIGDTRSALALAGQEGRPE